MEKQKFRITVHGCASHGATPHLGADAIVAVSKIIEGMQTIVSRSSNPLDEVSVTMENIQSGTQFNIIADRAVLDGQIQVTGKDLLAWTQDEIRRIATHTAEAMKCTAETDFSQETA